MYAGKFSEWLRAMRSALAGGPGMDVACGSCVGCCTSSYFIKVRAHENGARAAIGAARLTASPDEPGVELMGYDAHGHCPMFRDGACSIYSDRPGTCRTYDCRVFTAAGMSAGEGRPMINERVASWRFDYPDELDRREQRAVTAAANYLRQHPVRFPGGRVPSRPAEVAVLAIKAYPVFMNPPASDADIRAAIVGATHEFDRGSH